MKQDFLSMAIHDVRHIVLDEITQVANFVVRDLWIVDKNGYQVKIQLYGDQLENISVKVVS